MRSVSIYCGRVYATLTRDILGGPNNGNNSRGRAPRGPIKKCSVHSLKRLRRYLLDHLAHYRSFISLTFPDNAPDTKEAKRCLRAFLTWLRRNHNEAHGTFSACWVLEYQKRGAPHFHIVYTGYVDKALLAKRWAEIYGHGVTDEKHQRYGSRIQSIKGGRREMSRYLSKYITKEVSKGNNGWNGRYWGIRGYGEHVGAHTHVSEQFLKPLIGPIAEKIALIEAIFDMNVALGSLKKTDFPVTVDDGTVICCTSVYLALSPTGSSALEHVRSVVADINEDLAKCISQRMIALASHREIRTSREDETLHNS